MFVTFDTRKGKHAFEASHVTGLRPAGSFILHDTLCHETDLLFQNGAEWRVFGTMEEIAARLDAAQHSSSGGLNLPEYLTRHIRRESTKEAIPESFPVADPNIAGQEIRPMDIGDVILPTALPAYVPEAWNDVPCAACLGTGKIIAEARDVPSLEIRTFPVDCVQCFGQGFTREKSVPTELDVGDEITSPSGERIA